MVKVAIFHEGNAKKTSDNELIELLLEKQEIKAEEKVKFFAMGSKSNFFKADNKNYRQLKLDIESEQIGKVLFMLDADRAENDATYGGYDNTKREMQLIIEELGIAMVSDIYIACDETKTGCLESLIFSTIPDERKKCITELDFCSNSTTTSTKHPHKELLNLYRCVYRSDGLDNLKHPNFNELKQKLKNLFA